MSWLSGLWGWGEADAGEWLSLYRIEGARRAYRWSVAWLEESRREREEQQAWRAWRRSPEGEADEARRRAEQEAYYEQQSRLRVRARTKSPLWAPGSRNYRIWAAYRAGGRTLADVGRSFGMSGSRVSGIVQVQQRVEDARATLKAEKWRRTTAARQNLGRPLDMGGPRDVWLTYGPSPDPRLDNMAPVTSEDV